MSRLIRSNFVSIQSKVSFVSLDESEEDDESELDDPLFEEDLPEVPEDLVEEDLVEDFLDEVFFFFEEAEGGKRPPDA